MNAIVRPLLIVITAVGLSLLAGCATHPELRSYTAQEVRQLRLEALQRQGLSLDAYERQRAVIIRADQAEMAASSEQSVDGFSG